MNLHNNFKSYILKPVTIWHEAKTNRKRSSQLLYMLDEKYYRNTHINPNQEICRRQQWKAQSMARKAANEELRKGAVVGVQISSSSLEKSMESDRNRASAETT
ncbi:hypothetical protein LOK49_LG11G01370 [Camellia lanceoleosa]|uniref:Uncharacterized protein n=1 Tax=Camellia lanceoleosa TaxID=1840588 RepID=A0ACC0G3D3_9ERIC|nr:hypothetical protein LOK49_LG11G01370 [Camellia lanceoleosa]